MRARRFWRAAASEAIRLLWSRPSWLDRPRIVHHEDTKGLRKAYLDDALQEITTRHGVRGQAKRDPALAPPGLKQQRQLLRGKAYGSRPDGFTRSRGDAEKTFTTKTRRKRRGGERLTE